MNAALEPVRVLRLTPSATFVSAASFEASFTRHLAGAFSTTTSGSADWCGEVLGHRLPAREQAARFAAATQDVDFLFPGFDLAQMLPRLVELRNRAGSRARFLIRAHSPALCPLEWALLGALVTPGDVIVCPSPSARALVSYLTPELESNLVVSPPPVALPPVLGGARRDGRRVRLVTLGRLIPTKLLHRVLDGVAALPPDLRSRTELHIGGPLEEERRPLPYAATLAARSERLGLTDAVRLHGLIPPEAVKARFLGTADALVNLSVSPEESFGVAVAEALCAGTPSVVTRWDGLPGVAGPAGAVVPVTPRGTLGSCDVAPADVAAAIEQVVGDPAARLACHEQAARFSPARTAEDLADTLRRALDAARGGPPGPAREDLRDRPAAAAGGLLARTAPLPDLRWGELFDACAVPGKPGEGLRRQLGEAVLAPVTRFMAGLPPPWGDEPEAGATTATSELAAMWHAAAGGAVPGPADRLAALGRMPGRDLAVRLVEVERARRSGDPAGAADLACQAMDGLLAGAGTEHVLRVARQLTSVCRATGRAGDAAERLRTWLDRFPDEPATPAVWLLLARLAASAGLVSTAADAIGQASRFLGDDDPALAPVAAELLLIGPGVAATPQAR